MLSTKQILRGYLFYSVLFFMLVLALVNGIQISLYREAVTVDEPVYGDIARDWNQKGMVPALLQHNDNKPVTFLYLQKLLRADEGVLYTRLFNAALVVAVAVLIFSLTKRYESFLFPLIPIYLNSMWLTVEIIEMLFLLLALKYQSKAGWFVGLAALFRPYAVLYSVFLKRKHVIYMLLVGLAFALLLLYYGLFFPYLARVVHYGAQEGWETDSDLEALTIVLLILFAIAGSRNKKLFKYGLISCIPLILRMYGHYFLPPFMWFFLAYLSEDK